MAAQRGIQFQEKVSRLLSRQNGKPVLKPNRTLALKDAVANRKLKKGEATCITEMSVLMACWKQNNFVDGLCSNEVKDFYICVEKAQAAMKNKSEQTKMQGGRLHPKQATTLLKRFPNLRTEI
ncbi:small ribosomal subunit protein mS37 [Sparus aurata]|uniref:Coiled-coil-helix-coiled-coil-helix domain containing 1 n=1 Tax=Sparus aurata TaxID=8175 RepID=A0A671WLC9_SPAAU|nr:coiled-coil-helix-coiled-coil-helix domain-containing protein 1 [Sparus aurata]